MARNAKVMGGFNYLEISATAWSGNVASHLRTTGRPYQFLEFCPAPGRTFGRGDYQDLRAFLATALKQNRKTTVARKLSTLRTFFKYLQRQGILSQNPAKLAPSPKLEKALPHYLSVDEAFHLLDEPKGDDFGYAGIRPYWKCFGRETAALGVGWTQPGRPGPGVGGSPGLGQRQQERLAPGSSPKKP
jgi:integrase